MRSSRLRRPARLHLAWLAFLGSLALLAGLVTVLASPWHWLSPRRAGRPLVVLCAAGLKGPVEAAARQYQEEYGGVVQMSYGGSNTLLAQLQVNDGADLYVPADDHYVHAARDRELIDEVLPLAHMRPVLAVRQGNPDGVRSLDDLLKRQLRVAGANPEAAAVGQLARAALGRAGLWQRFERCVVVTKPTVNDVAADVQVGAVTAGVVWDATVRQIPGLEVVAVPAFEGVTAQLSACVARRSPQPTEALRFARYLAARDRGLVLFERHGFRPVEGDRWEQTPELRLYAGAMLRPAIDDTVTAFAQREGVEVTRVYNGCGILVAQMRTGKEGPDAYFACDSEFMDQVQDLFGPPRTISGNQLVILVHKGNPHHIRRMADLARPGLRVGIGHEKQCAMGVLTQETLRQDRSHDPVMKNVVVQSPTGDLLVNQLRTKALDAAVAYLSNAAGSADVLEAILIDIPCAFAEQPFAIGKGSDFKHLAGRLLDAIRARASRERFEAFGFTWKDRVRRSARGK